MMYALLVTLELLLTAIRSVLVTLEMMDCIVVWLNTEEQEDMLGNLEMVLMITECLLDARQTTEMATARSMAL